MANDSESKFWLNNVIDEVVEKYPEGKITVSSGISPSASYHIGHFREILSADLVRWGLEQRGREVEHIHVVDNFDPLRKRYDFLPEEYEQYVGWPVCLVPDPKDCHDSYAEHFFQEFYQWVERLNIPATVVRSYQDLYLNGKMTPQIEQAVDGADKIKEIFKNLSNRDLPQDWMPLQILSENKSFNEWRFSSIDKGSKEIQYSSEDGKSGGLKYDDGQVKLNWRLDWPARWQLLGVQVEPHGFQEHGASGGSFDTGTMFAREVFNFDPPLAGFQYGHVHLAGDPIKMSSSKNNLITPEDAFKIMPTEMLRYFYARYPGKKKIEFDPGLGLFRMMDEFAEVDRAVANGEEHQFAEAYSYAVDGLETPGMSSVPFSHLVTAEQSSNGDENSVMDMLKRSGYEDAVSNQSEAITRQLGYVRAWLDNYAPEESKFKLQKELPTVELSVEQKKMLENFAERLEKQDDKSAEWFHHSVHELREDVGLEPKQAFAAIYRVLLDKDSGPKAGWYLSILDRSWLIARFKQAAQS